MNKNHTALSSTRWCILTMLRSIVRSSCYSKLRGNELINRCNRLLMSTTLDVLPPIKVNQGGILRIKVAESVKHADILLETNWEELFKVETSDASIIRCNSNGDNITMDVGNETSTTNGIKLHIIVPELFDVSIKGPTMHLTMQNKLMGNLLVAIPDGKVSIDKVKGPEIGIYIGEGDLSIKRVIEGNISIQCKNIHGKMINGEIISIATTDSVEVGAMYGSNTTIQAGGKIDLGLFRGQIQCDSNGNCNIRGIDGAVSVQSHQGDIHLHINSLTKLMHNDGSDVSHSEDPTSAAQTTEASISHGSNSAFAKEGNIFCQLDPEAKLNVYCEGGKSEDKGVSVISDAFTTEYAGNASILGHFTGISKAMKRPTFGTHGSGGVGKINLSGAEKQSSYRGGSATGSGTLSEEEEKMLATSAEVEHREIAGISTENWPSLLAVAPDGRVTMKTMSWIEMIKSKHGVE